jgi:plasmid maintenance system antidote protein VapI
MRGDFMLYELIRQHIDTRGIKHAYVADEIGVARNVLSSMLTGKRKITAEEYILICNAINTDTNYIAEKFMTAI